MAAEEYDKMIADLKERQRLRRELDERIAEKLKKLESKERVPADEKENVDELQENSISNKGSGQSIDDIISNTNSKVLLDVLSPEVSKNEDKKRTHKDKLMKMMGMFLVFQFIFTALLVGTSVVFIALCHYKEIPFDDETIKIIFTFVSAYITSVVVELIAILNYIVQKVFDTSVADLVAIFKDGSNKAEEKK